MKWVLLILFAGQIHNLPGGNNHLEFVVSKECEDTAAQLLKAYREQAKNPDLLEAICLPMPR